MAKMGKGLRRMYAARTGNGGFLDDYALVNTAEVLEATTFSRSTLNRRIEEGLFPKPYSLGRPDGSDGFRIAWRLRDVREFLENLPLRNEPLPPKGRRTGRRPAAELSQS